MIKPKALRKGDTVALIRPSSRLKDGLFKNAVKSVRAAGFCVTEFSGSFRSDPFFSAPDEDRAAELDWAMREPGIKAIFVCRGGYGLHRTLSLISPSQAKKWCPKIILGYSDVTYLHQWVQNQLGWVTFHGPLLGSLKSQELQTLLKTVLKLPVTRDSHVFSEIKNIHGKKSARGKLVGGNLSLLQVAGRAELPKEPLILAIEDVNENFYRIDRMLMTLLDAGYARFIKGILVGTWKGCGQGDHRSFKMSRVYDSLRRLTSGPIWMNCGFGHGLRQQWILPLGCQIEMRGKKLSLLEAAVK